MSDNGQLPEEIGVCESCMKIIREGDRFAPCSDDIKLCKDCAPTYQDMVDRPSYFEDDEGEPLTFRKAKNMADAHAATGGKLTDKMVIS